jgi:hypothetical protein
MIDKSVFLEIGNLKKEYEDIEKRIDIEKDSRVVDSVQGSSKFFPYTKHNFFIGGYGDEVKLKRYEKMLKNKKKQIEKKLLNFEYQLNYVDDSEMRMILRLKYIDGLKNYQIANEMNKNGAKVFTEDSVRMRIKRFFKKN